MEIYTCILSCRFGFDVPVILRSSDETESTLPTPEKQMVQVINPFALQIGSGPASVTGESASGNRVPGYKSFIQHILLLLLETELTILFLLTCEIFK